MSGYGRDLKMTLGGLSMTNTPDGMRIQDTWDIDPASEVAKDASTGITERDKDRLDLVVDLQEGGNVPSLIANAARALNTYEPIEIDQTIPANTWNSITPREISFEERVANNQGPALQAMNNLYSNLFKRQ